MSRDLNVIQSNEKIPAFIGKSIRCTEFNKFNKTSVLIDICYLGDPFSWYYKRETINAIL